MLARCNNAQDKECYMVTAAGEQILGPVVVWRYPVTGILDIEVNDLECALENTALCSGLRHSFFHDKQ